MKKFIGKIVQYSLLLMCVAGMYVLLIYFRPELVDNFYRRFTTERPPSLIIGTSRSAQGILPAIINQRVCTDNNRILNHSFAIGPSSYGPNYLREIQQKLHPSSSNGVFILSVDPWSLATNVENTTDDPLKFFEVESEMFVGNLSSSSTNPNLEYLIKYWSNRFAVFGNGFKHLIHYGGILELHEDGWLEVNIKIDTAYFATRIKNSTEEYRNKNMYLSDTRIQYLEEIITVLRERGEIYLVRMPVSANMAALEKIKFPSFNARMQQLSNKYSIPYFDFIDESGKYMTVDTHHLYKEEGKKVTYRICDSILRHQSPVAVQGMVGESGR